MKIRTFRMIATLVLVSLSVGVSAGCKSMPTFPHRLHWPWAAKSVPVPPPANQIAWEAVEGGTAVEFPQSWARNTLIIDMTSAIGTGRVRMHPKASMGWPVRIALRVKPGAVAEVEVDAAQRLVMPVLPGGGASVDLPIDPGVYLSHTETITLAWH